MVTFVLILIVTFVAAEVTGTSLDHSSCTDQIKYLTSLMEEMNKTIQASAEKLKSFEAVRSQFPDTTVAFFSMSTQDLTLGDKQTIIFDKTITNVGSGYDAYDGQFTAPVTGLYFFSATLMAYPGHYIHAELVHNGQNLAYVFAAKGAYAYEDDTGTAIANVVLQQGDKVWVRHMTDPSGVARMEENHTTFSGFLITDAIG